MSKPKTKPHLHLTVDEVGVELNCLLPNGFEVAVSGSVESLIPLLKTVVEEFRKHINLEAQ